MTSIPALALALACAEGDAPGRGSLLELVFADGSGNTTALTRAHAGDRFRLCYDPVRPERSSSGLYSGGEPRTARLSAAESTALEGWAARVEDAAELHREDRPKGTGTFTIRRTEGGRRVVLREGELLSGFESFVDGIRARGERGACE